MAAQSNLLSSLKPNEGATHYRKRVGRGIGSGLGGYSGKGGKGQTQRSGGSIRRGFEGGQTPLHRRLPKFGFTNTQFKTSYTVLTMNDLNRLSSNVTIADLKTQFKNGPFKVINTGKLEKKVNIEVNKITVQAKSVIEKLGGIVKLV
ncbi:MAG: 50S ribosomal protein L15 [Bdellovibrionaceae bacterium]|nr:50S ribosomal protein L15 [Pseudobdellovibrionaceae bacterium]